MVSSTNKLPKRLEREKRKGEKEKIKRDNKRNKERGKRAISIVYLKKLQVRKQLQ